MGTLHIYRAEGQAATDYSLACIGLRGRRIRAAGNDWAWSQCCCQRRQLKNLRVYVYYDATYYFCARDKGCKDPNFLAAKRRREFKNRSAGAKRGWQTRLFRATNRPLKEGK